MPRALTLAYLVFIQVDELPVPVTTVCVEIVCLSVSVHYALYITVLTTLYLQYTLPVCIGVVLKLRQKFNMSCSTYLSAVLKLVTTFKLSDCTTSLALIYYSSLTTWSTSECCNSAACLPQSDSITDSVNKNLDAELKASQHKRGKSGQI